MKPVLIAPPTDPVVSLSDLKEHLRVDHTDEDVLIAALETAAVAHLDGWTGVLGRCIMPQTWQLELCSGEHLLPFPDVTDATLYGDGDPIAIDVEFTQSGPLVNLPEAGRLEFTCAMSQELLPAAQVAVKVWVQHVYDEHPAGPSEGTVFRSLVSALRWWRA